MLHKINLPDCTAHLNWVVRLQCNLLHALCDPDLAPADVTADWAIALRPDVDGDWIRRLCRWSKTKKSMLARMKAVAGLAVDEKQAVITHYEANMQFPDSFDDAKEAPPATTPLPNGLSADAEAAYRDYFLMFYDPIFYGQKGYPIDDPNLNGKWFTKDSYLESYHAANPAIKVCPLCDGTMDGAEVDHWLAKNRHFPELNCHPQNLVEICGACNGRTNKGEKLALDTGTMDPFKNWFHPYMRPAAGGLRLRS